MNFVEEERKEIDQDDVGLSVEDLSLERNPKQPLILESNFSLWIICEFLDPEDILSLGQISQFVRSNVPNVHLLIKKKVSSESDHFKKTYELNKVTSLRMSAPLMLEELPFIQEIFTSPRKGKLYVKKFVEELENCKHRNDAGKCNICQTGAMFFKKHYFEKNKIFARMSSLEASFVTSVAMYLYH